MVFREDHSFCATPFWDLNITWYTTSPDFTPCFQNTVLVLVPCGFLFLGTMVSFLTSNLEKKRPLPWTVLNISKLVLSVLLLTVSAAELIYATGTSSEGGGAPVATILSPAMKFSTFLFVIWLQHRCRRKGVRNSAVLFFFWCLLSVGGVVTYRSTLNPISSMVPEDLSDIRFIVIMVYYPIVLSQLVLSAFNEISPDPAKIVMEEESILSRISFAFIERVVFRGFRHTLNVENLVFLISELKSKYAWTRFSSMYLRQESSASRKQLAVPIDKDGDYCKHNEKVVFQPKTSLPRALAKAFWPMVVKGGLVELSFLFFRFITPNILSLLIGFTTSEEALWRGYLYAFLLFFCTLLSDLFTTHSAYFSMSSGLQIRTALVGAVYRKSLRLSCTSRRQYTLGELVNLMAIDAERVLQLMMYINLLWSAPLRITVALVLLWQYVGPSCMAALVVMVVIIPITGTLASWNRFVQKEQMNKKDFRLKKISDMLNGIRVLKLYAWEIPFMNQIKAIRDEELKLLRKFSFCNAALYFLWGCTTFLNTISTFVTYVLIDKNNVLDASTAFVSLTLFNMIQSSLSNIPDLISNMVQTSISFKRLDKYFRCEELDPDCIETSPAQGEAVTVEKATVSWDKEDISFLTDITLHVPRGRLVAIVGRVACGKSSLLSAILGEMYKLKGRIYVKGSIAYVPQQAWIQNATLRQNIVFLKPYERHFYRKVLNMCCLQPDIAMLHCGDLTEIGEKGINLSGGQKQRVSLARAVYQDADMYLLDDPLSAVDSHVGKQLFKHVIGPEGILRNKTRILVTHALTVLPKADLIVSMSQGKILDVGTYQELLMRGTLPVNELKQTQTAPSEDSFTKEDMSCIKKASFERLNSRDGFQDSILHLRSISRESKSIEEEEMLVANQEKMEEGKVRASVYLKYLKNSSALYSVTTALGFIIYQVFTVSADVWLSEWSGDKPLPDGSQDIFLRNIRIAVYGLLGLLSSLSFLMGNIALALGATTASRKLHHEMLTSVIKSPMEFFDTTPLGRLLNRFGKDMSVVDTNVPEIISLVMSSALSVFGILVVVCISMPIFIAILIPISIIYYFLQKLYMESSRQVKRLESVKRSPVYSHFSESVQGASSLRAYSAEQRFAELSDMKVDTNTRCFFQNMLLNRWIVVRLEVLSCIIVLLASILSVVGRGKIEAGTVGLVLSYILKMTESLSLIVRRWTNLEIRLISVERVDEYCRLTPEAPWNVDKQCDPFWPSDGAVSFVEYKTRYREGLDLVLKGVNLTILPKEKIGIVGRTGAGKTSLTLALFRMVEASEGSIVIDGIDISKIGLHDLRSKLTIIPQEPLLFSGSFRMNIDPNNEYTDENIWRVLQSSHLKEFVSSLPDGLNHVVAEGGEDLSVGQRQLVCLARALLKKTKILVLDEATAAVDMETDRLIQNTIRTEFVDCTIITIAHRLHTILDSDRVIVMKDGQIIEQSPPEELLKNPDSYFYSLAKSAGIV